MANFKVLKKIAALVTAIALVVCFAVSASAIGVVTTTSYVDDNDALVNVHVAVTGLDDADAYVTYYATQSGTPVHIDQVVAASNAADFYFQTEATKLESSVVIGRTSADAAHTGETIDGLAITWSIEGGATTTEVIATEAESYTIAYTPSASDKIYASVELNGEAVEAELAGGNVVVSLESLEADARAATIVIKEQDKPVDLPSITASAITAAAVNVADGDYTIYDEEGKEITAEDEALVAAEGNRKLTVIGNAAGAEEFGIIVSYEAITVDRLSAAQFAEYDSYKALGATEAGTFAVQLIDSATEAHEVIPDAGVYVAVYALADNGVYSIAAVADAVPVQ